MDKYVYLKEPRKQILMRSEYSKKNWMEQGYYKISRFIHKHGYLVFTGNSMNPKEKTLIRECDCELIEN